MWFEIKRLICTIIKFFSFLVHSIVIHSDDSCVEKCRKERLVLSKALLMKLSPKFMDLHSKMKSRTDFLLKRWWCGSYNLLQYLSLCGEIFRNYQQLMVFIMVLSSKSEKLANSLSYLVIISLGRDAESASRRLECKKIIPILVCNVSRGDNSSSGL